MERTMKQEKEYYNKLNDLHEEVIRQIMPVLLMGESFTPEEHNKRILAASLLLDAVVKIKKSPLLSTEKALDLAAKDQKKKRELVRQYLGDEEDGETEEGKPEGETLQ